MRSINIKAVLWTGLLAWALSLVSCQNPAGIQVPASSLRLSRNQGPDAVLGYLESSGQGTVIGNFPVLSARQGIFPDSLEVVGNIAYDARFLHAVAARISGRVQYPYIHYSGQKVRKGDPLLRIYSPALLTAQADLLQAIRQKDSSLVYPLKAALENLGMDGREIRQLIRTGKARTGFTLYSPYQGIVLPGNSRGLSGPVAPLSSMETGMQISKIRPSEVSRSGSLSLDLQKGIYVSEGQELLAIQDISRLWVILNIPGTDMASIRLGDSVLLDLPSDPGRRIRARVDFIPPFREGSSQTSPVRLYLDHPSRDWKAGALVRGKILLGSLSGVVWLPAASVEKLGFRDIVWIQDPGNPRVFRVRELRVGRQVGNQVPVLSGLEPGDRIARVASFMSGSDGFVP